MNHFTFDEGSRYDIICLGFVILQMLGKFENQQFKHPPNAILSNSKYLTSTYKKDGCVSSKMSNFLDLCFDERTTLEILKRCPLMGYSSSSMVDPSKIEESPASSASIRSIIRDPNQSMMTFNSGVGSQRGSDASETKLL